KPLRARLGQERDSKEKVVINEALGALRTRLVGSKPDSSKNNEVVEWLVYIGDLRDSALLPQIAGYLNPPHSDQSVRQAALRALASIRNPDGLLVVKGFLENTAPHGETLKVARQAKLVL